MQPAAWMKYSMAESGVAQGCEIPSAQGALGAAPRLSTAAEAEPNAPASTTALWHHGFVPQLAEDLGHNLGPLAVLVNPIKEEASVVGILIMVRPVEGQSAVGDQNAVKSNAKCLA